MKRILSSILTVFLLVSLVAISGCSKKPAETVKLGLGIISEYGKSTSADGDTDGTTEIVVTAAAVVLDGTGKIVKCAIDSAQNKVSYTSAGKAVSNAEFKTKGELGSAYGMAAYGNDLNGDGVVKEWNEQVAVFVSSVEGKTMDEVKALVVDGYGNADLQTAGCTMAVSEFVSALEKAVANAVESTATAQDKLQLGIVTSQSVSDATEEKNGTNEVNTSCTAAILGEGGKVIVAATDTQQAKITFDQKGLVTTDISKALKTKKEQGSNYGMAAYGNDLNGDGTVKEWNEQAAAFDAALAGKTAAEIAALEVNGYGVESLQSAGCTIAVSDMVKAAVKASTVG